MKNNKDYLKCCTRFVNSAVVAHYLAKAISSSQYHRFQSTFDFIVAEETGLHHYVHGASETRQIKKRKLLHFTIGISGIGLFNIILGISIPIYKSPNKVQAKKSMNHKYFIIYHAGICFSQKLSS